MVSRNVLRIPSFSVRTRKKLESYKIYKYLCTLIESRTKFPSKFPPLFSERDETPSSDASYPLRTDYAQPLEY